MVGLRPSFLRSRTTTTFENAKRNMLAGRAARLHLRFSFSNFDSMKRDHRFECKPPTESTRSASSVSTCHKLSNNRYSWRLC